MSNTTSVTLLLLAAKQGDQAAIEKLWRRFENRMSVLTARWLARVAPAAAFDEDDVTVTAFQAFLRGLKDGRYDDLSGRDELWRLLATITVRKAGEFLDTEQAQKRGSEVRIVSLDQTGPNNAAEQPGRQSSPEFTAIMSEECRRLLDRLDDPELEAVVLCKLEGNTNEEIAEEMGYSRRSIQRMLNRIREIWRNEADE